MEGKICHASPVDRHITLAVHTANSLHPRPLFVHVLFALKGWGGKLACNLVLEHRHGSLPGTCRIPALEGEPTTHIKFLVVLTPGRNGSVRR